MADTDIETGVADETIETETEARATRTRRPIPPVNDLLARFDGAGAAEKTSFDVERESRVQRVEQVLKGAAIEVATLTNGTSDPDSAGRAIISIRTAARRASKAVAALPDDEIVL